MKLHEPTKSGFFDLNRIQMCRHPEHNAPTHINIPAGKGYVHVCPACKASQTIVPQEFTL